MEPYYLILRLPSEEKEEFVLLIPFTLSKEGQLGRVAGGPERPAPTTGSSSSTTSPSRN